MTGFEKSQSIFQTSPRSKFAWQYPKKAPLSTTPVSVTKQLLVSPLEFLQGAFCQLNEDFFDHFELLLK
jgi:hypothetical protein